MVNYQNQVEEVVRVWAAEENNKEKNAKVMVV